MRYPLQTVEGFDMGSGSSVMFKLEEGREALEKWAGKAVDALKWSESSGSSIRNVRERMVQAAKERFLVDSVVAK